MVEFFGLGLVIAIVVLVVTVFSEMHGSKRDRAQASDDASEAHGDAPEHSDPHGGSWSTD